MGVSRCIAALVAKAARALSAPEAPVPGEEVVIVGWAGM